MQTKTINPYDEWLRPPMSFSGHRARFLAQVFLMLTYLAAAGELMAQERSLVPDDTAERTAKRMAGEIYGGRFALAKTAADKTALAAEMIEAALKVQNGSADQFVLLRIARDVALGAGDAPTALAAVKELVQRFEVAAATLTAETFLAAAQQATMSGQRKAVAEAGPSVLAQLSQADEHELAIRVCEAAREAAQKAREFKLAADLSGRLPELRRMQKEFQTYREALAVMEDDPAQPGANLTAGRYLCLVKGDWQRGVPMLALGSDADLRSVALLELRGAASADAQTVIGDAWWDAAETRPGDERDLLRLRAGSWYRQAAPSVAGGLAGMKIKQRLDAISKLGREIPAASSPPATLQKSPPLAIAPFDEKAATQYQAAWAKHLNVPVLWTNTIGMRFVLIPPGEFDMEATEKETVRLLDEAKARVQKSPGGDLERLPSEAPKHRVRITRPYYAGIWEVTQAEYERVMGTNPSRLKGNPSRPVEHVSWSEAVDFCRRLGELAEEKKAGAVYRLLTEAEWEYACRAGTTTQYRSGDDEGILGQYAWWANNSAGRTQPVGQLRPNAFGLFDMWGNVWEWCADWHADDRYANSSPEDPTGPDSGSSRVLCGGSWRTTLRDYSAPRIITSAPPEERSSAWGFRVAKMTGGT
jgi:formylglycine-generating enzyme required for sulfatase activity